MDRYGNPVQGPGQPCLNSLSGAGQSSHNPEAYRNTLAPPQPPRETIVTGLARLDELEKRLEGLLLRATRIANSIGYEPGINVGHSEGKIPPSLPPKPECLLPRLLEISHSCHELSRLIDDQLGRLEVQILG